MKNSQKQTFKTTVMKFVYLFIWLLAWHGIDVVLDFFIDFLGPTDIIIFFISSHGFTVGLTWVGIFITVVVIWYYFFTKD